MTVDSSTVESVPRPPSPTAKSSGRADATSRPRGEHRGHSGRDGEPDRQRGERLPGQANTAPDNAHAQRAERQQVRAHRHRPDDQDRVAIDHAQRGNDPGHSHQRQVAADRPCLRTSLAQHLDPGEALGPAGRARAASQRTDDVQPREQRRVARDPGL
jgi:hypothetical protein